MQIYTWVSLVLYILFVSGTINLQGDNWIPQHRTFDGIEDHERQDVVIQNSEISGALNILDGKQAYLHIFFILKYYP